MDLVDIDKVLDNLELNEEEHKLEIPNIRQLQTLNSTGLSSQNASASINEAKQQNNAFGISPTSSNATCDRVNKFIGVSHVFSSLDVYRKNVETLDTGIYTNNTNKKKEQLENTKNCAGVESDRAYQIPDEEVDEDRYTDDEINKFVSADEYGLSSNSITTSSSSTFSSGLSPALISSESDSSFDMNQVAKSIHKENGKQSAAFDHIDSAKSTSIYSAWNKDLQHRSEYDELAVGLSSISLTQHGSSLSSEIVSSKFQSENISSSLSLSKTAQININSEEIHVTKPIDTDEVRSPNDQNKHQDNNENSESDIVEKDDSNAGNPAHHVMVTFGSTMDEISDTELDSILQEIDVEMPSQHLTENTYSGAREQNPTSSVEQQIVSKKGKKRAYSYSNRKRRTSTELAIAAWFGEEWIDSDSSSQASTIEYAEDRHAEEKENDCCKNESENYDVEEQEDVKQSVSLKRQRPTTLDLPVKKISLYATAGQTPPGSQIYEHTTSSSEEDTPGNKSGSLNSPRNVHFNSGAGHTPPELSDKSNFGADIPQLENTSLASSYDDRMMLTESVQNQNEIEIPVSTSTYVNPSAAETTNNLGKVPPIWVPDQEANLCMQCQQKFTLLKRRHHCRACGQVLCSVCCSQKFKLEFLSNLESRVCVQCYLILSKLQQQIEQQPSSSTLNFHPAVRAPNPNNPMEYCSKIPPHRQVGSQIMSYPTVIVPVGVLKKEGNATKSRKRKSVMFSDGIRPGSDLASLDRKWSDAKHARKSTPSSSFSSDNAGCMLKTSNRPTVNRHIGTSIALTSDSAGNSIHTADKTLPPTIISENSETIYQEVANNADLIKRLRTESLKFLIHTNFFVHVKIVHLKCCINKTVINFTTCGLYNVGSDEIIILLELDDSNEIPKDIFVYLNEVYWEASKGHPVTEMAFSTPKDLSFLGSREHGGFLFLRSTFQCLIDVHVPNSPFLIGVLIHRWEVPWAKIFPLRLMLRLGAQYRYYPSPHISVREREPVYADIAQTIINLLADFRNYTYTLPTIKGLYIHMEERKTNILIPRNRHDDVIKAIKNSSDHILALGANFSKKADGHLVCIQNLKTESDSNSYSTQAINIQGQPRKVTGASFFVLNEALKSNSGLSGKCSIIEDGLMVQILPSKMIDIRNALMNMKDIDIVCGPIVAGEQQTEVVYIQWVEDDTEINIGVRSPVDSRKLDGIPSIRVHSGVSLSNTYHILKWTEVFMIEISGENATCKATVDISKVSEQIAKNASVALLPFLELLVANGSKTIGLRVTLNPDNVCYEAGSQNEKLPPLYMNALDNELIPTLHRLANEIEIVLVLELIFHILNENVEPL